MLSDRWILRGRFPFQSVLFIISLRLVSPVKNNRTKGLATGCNEIGQLATLFLKNVYSAFTVHYVLPGVMYLII